MKEPMHPYAEVCVAFFTAEEGGRQAPIHLNDQGYRPHIRTRPEGTLLGVEFVDGPDDPIMPGQTSYATVHFMYDPEVSYHELVEGATFEVLEGPEQVVGRGRVTRR